MFVIISYDIVDDKRRTKLAKKLKDYATRVQYSVFEANLEPQQYAKLKGLVAKSINTKEDSVRLYRLCRPCIENVELLGKGEVTHDEDFYIL